MRNLNQIQCEIRIKNSAWKALRAVAVVALAVTMLRIGLYFYDRPPLAGSRS